MDKTRFLTIFPTYGKLDVVNKTLPSIILETKQNDARLIVHDSTELEDGREKKWQYLNELNQNSDFFLLLTSNLSMAHARNLCLNLGQEMYAPDYICMVEDDHGFQPGLIPNIIEAMDSHYGKVSENGLRYGLFTACYKHTHASLNRINEKYGYPDEKNKPFVMGGFNSCFRCAPTNHWNAVLKGYDTDEYLISEYQTGTLRWRNYHKGFTVLFVGNGDLVFSYDEGGRGLSSKGSFRRYDSNYCASDRRSTYLGKGRKKDQ